MPDPSDQSFEAELDGAPTSSDPDGLRARLPFEVLATQFMDEYRQGQHPSIDDYVARYPRLAETIREFFPMLQAMEQLKADKESTQLRFQFPDLSGLERLGDYRIIREIGRGGMGIVFEGVQDPGHRRVAVKVLPWKVDGVPRWRERFESEARTAARLRHRNIVPIYSFGEYDGYCYYVMHFVDGVGLDWIIRRLCETDGVVYADEIRHLRGSVGPRRDQDAHVQSTPNSSHIPTDAADKPRVVDADPSRRLKRDSWRMISRIGLQVAQALGYAHQAGTLHNDIKPGNLLLDARGLVWITDFGLAAPLDPGPQCQQPDRITGTLRYMAPERFLGQCDQRSDLYSLGLTLYELATLTPAFESGPREEMVRQIIQCSPPVPRSINPDVPASLEAIILKMIAVHPPDRYQSAMEAAVDLTRFTQGKTIFTSSQTRKGRLSRVYRNLFGKDRNADPQ